MTKDLEETKIRGRGKVCLKCGKFKALRFFSKNGSSKDGYRSTCKDCDSLQQRECRKNMEYVAVKAKRCSQCGRILSIENFGADKTKKDKHRSYCKECANEQQKYRNRLLLLKKSRIKK